MCAKNIVNNFAISKNVKDVFIFFAKDIDFSSWMQKILKFFTKCQNDFCYYVGEKR